MTEPGWRKGVGWGWSWGDGDEIGALNAISPSSVLAALALASEGRIYDLGLPVDRTSFRSPVHPATEVASFRTPALAKRQQDIPMLDASTNTKEMAFISGLVICSDHIGTHIDGLGHMTTGADDQWYNGYTWSEDGGDFGPRKASADTTPPIVARGVMLDIASLHEVDVLAPGTAIGPEDLQAAAAGQGVELGVGDVVLIRTGSLGSWGETGSDHEKLRGPDTSGLNLAAARWLIEEHGSILVGSDTSMLEVFPAVDGDSWHPVHEYLLVDHGVHIGELHYLEQLAADARYEFCYVALLPKLRGLTGGFAMRPIAMV